MHKSKLVSLFLTLTLLFPLNACSDNTVVTNTDINTKQTAAPHEQRTETIPLLSTDSPPSPTTNINSYFEIHYIDVGQADASLILCDDKSMLIDGGNPEDSSLIVAYLKKHNIEHLDYVICSHAHNDHVGGLSGALSVATAGSIYAPKTKNDIKAYKSFIAKASAQNLVIKNPQPGDTLNLGSSTVKFLGPIHENVSDLNDTSIILKISYGKTSFLFTGDAERDEEQSVLAQDFDLSATVLKVGHHGSGDSTTYPFLREIMPEYAIISVGENNYGHPTEETLSRLRDADVKVFRTDLQGDIIVSSNGEEVTIHTERNQNIDTIAISDTLSVNSQPTLEQTYIGNTKSKKFHLESCHSLPIEKNRIYLSSRQEALESGFSPCRNCFAK